MGSALVCGRKEPYKAQDPKPKQQQPIAQEGNSANQASQQVPAAAAPQEAPIVDTDPPA